MDLRSPANFQMSTAKGDLLVSKEQQGSSDCTERGVPAWREAHITLCHVLCVSSGAAAGLHCCNLTTEPNLSLLLAPVPLSLFPALFFFFLLLIEKESC